MDALLLLHGATCKEESISVQDGVPIMCTFYKFYVLDDEKKYVEL